MTTITVFDDADGNHIGFELSGHALFAEHGKDIVCASISILAINTVNAIETFLLQEDEYEEMADPQSGLIRFMMKRTDPETQLMVDSMLLGLRGIESQHPKNIRLVSAKGMV